MHSFLSRRTVISALVVVLGLATALPAAATSAKPDPTVKKQGGFRLFAKASGSLRVNQIVCGILSDGQICVDSTGSSTIPGSVWPKGTNNQYTFNSGISVAGIIGPEVAAWAGDTTGAFFFDGAGKSNGEQVEPIFNASDPADLANWPEFALVPSGADPGADVYDPLLRGTVSASQGDIYFLNWDGNPSSTVGRPHPLGVAVETRGLAWNFPAGNQDIIYFIYTLYNITSANAADYAQHRPALASRLVQLGQQFQASNEASFGIDIPAGGYTLQDVFMDFAADQDVTAAAGANYSTFNNTFNMAITYHETFNPAPGNLFDPGIHAPPFLAGPGFVGTKYLRSPILPDGTEAGTVLAGETTNRGSFPDPVNTTQLYRYISGNLSAAAGDPSCNTGNKDLTRICFINPQPSDTRTFQSSGPLQLAPGASAVIVVAYMMAPPLSTGKCPSIPCPVTMVPDALKLVNATPASPGVDAVDSAMGYRGFRAGATEVTQENVLTAPNSLLRKATIAQTVFNGKFLLPFAPQTPDFFLVPGDNQVSVLWRPSASEASGDAFFAIANAPTVKDPDGNDLINTLYDPNYREFDVEGYRIYRGRTDTPSSLQLVAQFDFAGTVIYDFRGLVSPTEECAPELGIFTDCPSPFTIPVPGSRFLDSVGVELNGEIIQIKTGDRVALATGKALVINADTLITGGNSGLQVLANTGVPFAFTDDGSGLLSAPRNNVRYFYAVTAFDVNSLTSGPGSLESQRAARPVTPVAPASNVTAATLVSGLFGDDGVPLDPTQKLTLDPATGRFIGLPPPTDGVEGTFAPLVPVLLPAVSLIASIDSVKARVQDDPECAGQANALNACYIFYVTFDRDGAKTRFTVAQASPVWDAFGEPTQLSAQLGALPVLPDPATASRFGIPEGAGASNAAVATTSRQYIEFSSFEGQAARRNLIGNGAGVSPGGSRWFSGPDETVDHPGAGIRVGHLPGVDTVWAPIHHTDTDPATAAVQEGANSGTIQFFGYGSAGLSREADVQLTWGENGAVESVRDLTHHLPVEFKPDVQASYGFVQDANGDGRINWEDFNFIPGMAAFWVFQGLPNGPTDPAQAMPLVPTATVSPVSTAFATAPGTTGQGFGLYINSERYIFQLTGGALPAAGTQWTLRTYTGRVAATNNPASATPSGYAFTARVRSPVVPGLKVQFTVDRATVVNAATKSDLAAVHTVPDPYYVTSGFEQTTTDKIIKFVNLPTRALIRIYTSSGVLVTILEHNSTTLGGDETWNVRNRNNQVVASGVYFYHIEAGDARKVGRFTVVNFAQ